MSKEIRKRLPVDFYLDDPMHKMAWDYMEENVKVKSKWIRNIVIQYLVGTLQVPQNNNLQQSQNIDDIQLTEDDLDLDGMGGF